MALRFSSIFLILSTFSVLAQTQVEVPDHIYFAGMKLNLSKSLRNNMASQIQAIQKNKTYFQAKVVLADMYFPIIERVFTEEDIPLDFKYLAIQESSLQSDVVSTSNAVGYWQFKKESAIEVGVIVNSEVDERKHIVESSRGAARYLKKNYLAMTNWIYALIAYNTGIGGAKSFINSKYIGANEMDLDDDLHWYAIKFLAHKLAYEDKVGYSQPETFLLEYAKETIGKSLGKIAEQTGVAEEKILNYNKWALSKRVPDDKNCIVMLPVPYQEREEIAARLGVDLSNKAMAIADPAINKFSLTPKVVETSSNGKDEVYLFTTNNGLDGVVARETDNVAKLAFAGRISIEHFRQYNEMERYEEVKKGQIYYFESKNSKAIIPFHTVKAAESLWDIAQVYGIKVAQIKKKNRIEDSEAIQEGRLLYLRFKRPDKEPVIIAERPAPKPVEPIVKTPMVSVKNDSAKPKTDPLITIASVNINTLPAVIEPAVPVPPAEPVTNYSGIDTERKKDSLQVEKPIVRLEFPLPDSSFSYHLVKQGQTLYSLARYYGVKVDSLKLWNQIGPEGIKFDQKLIVSKTRSSLKSNFKIITVTNGQDLPSIASGLGVTPEKLQLWNDKKDQAVFTGEVLKVK